MKMFSLNMKMSSSISTLKKQTLINNFHFDESSLSTGTRRVDPFCSLYQELLGLCSSAIFSDPIN